MAGNRGAAERRGGCEYALEPDCLSSNPFAVLHSPPLIKGRVLKGKLLYWVVTRRMRKSTVPGT